MSVSKKLTGLMTTLAGSLIAVSASAGGALDLNLSDKAVRVAYDGAQQNSGLHLNLSALHHTDDGDMLGAGVHVVNVREPNSPLYLGVGVKAFGFTSDDYDGGALTIGGLFRYALPVKDMSLAGYAYFAPNVVSFGDIENMFNSDLRVQYAIIPNARVYTGYRYNSLSIEDVKDNYEFADTFHVGLTLDF